MIIALALHVLSVVLWIGGVGFVTTVLLPHVRATRPPAERLKAFEELERRFAWQARGLVLLAGVTGLYMLVRLDLWSAFATASGWWMHAMVGLWCVFAFMLFVAEPLFLDRWLIRQAARRPEQIFRMVERLHWLLFGLGVITVLGAVAGANGWP